MDIKYCLPIIEDDKDTIRLILNKYAKSYSYMEVWLDYIVSIDKEFCAELIEKYGNKIIFLFRRLNLEKPKMQQELRQEILSSLSGTVSLIDLDISDQITELKYCAHNKLKINLICSYHNYKETPSDVKLEELNRQMETFLPYIYKFSCFCGEQSDSVRLMSFLLKLKSENKKFIVLGMGEKGLVTRLFGTKWGNEMLFAPQEISKNSASGQYTKDKYEMIFKLL